MIFINYSLFLSWKAFQSYYNPKPDLTKSFYSRPGAINWTAIRSGYIDIGEGTPLYNRIMELGKIEQARSLTLDLSYTMDESPEFVDIFRSVGGNSPIAGDQKFANKVIREMPFTIVLLSLTKWHSFFTKRCFFPANNSFPGMIDFIRKFYIKFYSYLYRPFLIIFLISSFIILIKQKHLNLLYSSFGLLLYSSLIVTLGTGHAGEFIRYRVWVEYVMWFIALFPIGLFFEKIIFNVKKIFNF